MQHSAELRSFLVACRSARKNAAKRGVVYVLTRDDVMDAWERCGGRCEVSGIKFEPDAVGAKGARRPFAPSLDRIESSGGYTPDNIRVVCIAVNLAMNEWGEGVLLKIAAAMFHNGVFARIGRQDTSPMVLPADVRVYAGKKSIRYLARARDFGREVQLGSFQTIEEAVEARRAWAKANSSLKVLRQVYDFNRSSEILNEINSLKAA